jgi:hypothetical protein
MRCFEREFNLKSEGVVEEPRKTWKMWKREK